MQCGEPPLQQMVCTLIIGGDHQGSCVNGLAKTTYSVSCLQLSWAPLGSVLLSGGLFSLEDTNLSEKPPDKLILWPWWSMYSCILEYKTDTS